MASITHRAAIVNCNNAGTMHHGRSDWAKWFCIEMCVCVCVCVCVGESKGYEERDYFAATETACNLTCRLGQGSYMSTLMGLAKSESHQQTLLFSVSKNDCAKL